jgi:hypothetical protein
VTFGRYVLTATVTVPAGVSSNPTTGPGVTTSAVTSAAPGAGTTVTTQTAGPGSFLVSWTATLQTAAAAGDANNFGLYNAAVLLATSVNTGTLASFPQAAVITYLEASSAVAVKNIGAGTAGSVYSASLTLTPLTSGDSKGTVNWSGPGSPAGWSGGGFPVTFLAGTPLWLDTAGSLYTVLGGAANLRTWIDGQDNVGHGRWAALSN